MSFKRVDAEQEGVCPAVSVVSPSVAVCCVCGSSEGVKQCSRCKSAKYCSQKCQAEHWSSHSVICTSIRELEHRERERIYHDKTVRENQIDAKLKMNMAKLVGERPKIQCYLGGKKTKMLMDTGSGVTMVDRKWSK